MAHWCMQTVACLIRNGPTASLQRLMCIQLETHIAASVFRKHCARDRDSIFCHILVGLACFIGETVEKLAFTWSLNCFGQARGNAFLWLLSTPIKTRMFWQATARSRHSRGVKDL